MARYKITLTQTSWTGGTAAFWFDPDTETAYDAETGGDAITSITIPTRSGYTFLGFGLTGPYYRVIDESGNILATKVAELFNAASTAVTGSLAAKTLSIYQAQTSTISGATATLRTITIANTYWKDAPSKLYYNPAINKFYLDQSQTQELSAAIIARRECWTFSGCFAGAGPQYVSTTPAKSGDQYIDASGAILDELRIRAKVQTSFTVNPRGAYYSFKIVLDANGGTIGALGVSAIYRPTSATGTYYTDYLCTAGNEIAALAAAQLPSIDAKVYGGFTGTKVTTAAQAATATYYADKDGVLNTTNLDALPLSVTGSVALVKATVYARWVGACTVTISKGTNGTNAVLPLSSFYADTVNGLFYADQGMTEQIAGIGLPANECYRFLGCYEANTGNTQYIDDAGDITAALTIAEYTTSLTIYCKWAQTSWRLAMNKAGGSNGTDAIYRSVSSGDWYTDPLAEHGNTSPISALTPPERVGYIFLGYHKTSAATSDILAARDGALDFANLATVSPSGTTPPTATAYAVWQQLRTVNISTNATNATVGQLNTATAQPGDVQIFYGAEDQKFYLDNSAEVEVGIFGRPLVLPTVRCSRCTGIFGASANGDQKFDTGGLVVPELVAPTASNSIWYAQWERKSYVAVLDDNGGTGGDGAIFYNGDDAQMYTDDDLTSPASSVTAPARGGHTFLGYYTAKTGGTLVIEASGNVAAVTGFGSRDITLYAHWSVNQYTLAFVGSSTASKTVTFGAAIGTLPEPSATPPPSARFSSWAIDGLPISAATLWTWAEDKTATILWEYSFGDVVDYFGLASATLIPFESDEGSSRPHVVTRHYGKAAGASQTGPTWLNPTVKYMVVGDMTLTVQLGKAFAKKTETETGFMIVSALVETGLRKFPVVTISATANEGVDAINKFNIAVPILARARAQNILGAVSGGGELQSLSLLATCDPVVLQEALAPCASDVVNGRLEVHAETQSFNFESAPAASGGFTQTAAPPAKSGTDYTRFQMSATKEVY